MNGRLPERAVIPASTVAIDLTLGLYNEIGAGSHFEHVTFGDYAYCGPGCIMQNTDVGKFANVAAAVRIGPTRHPTDRASQHHFTYRRALYGFGPDDDEFFAWRRAQRAIIGPDTWLGHGAIVMPGVHVGAGAVVGAGAIVTRNVPPYAVVVGSPARVVKQRFDDEVAAALLRIAWWDWPHERVGAAMADFVGPIEAFVAAYDPVKR